MPVDEEDVTPVVMVTLEAFRPRALIRALGPGTAAPTASAFFRIKTLPDRWGRAQRIRPEGKTPYDDAVAVAVHDPNGLGRVFHDR